MGRQPFRRYFTAPLTDSLWAPAKVPLPVYVSGVTEWKRKVEMREKMKGKICEGGSEGMDKKNERRREGRGGITFSGQSQHAFPKCHFSSDVFRVIITIVFRATVASSKTQRLPEERSIDAYRALNDEWGSCHCGSSWPG